MKQAALLLWLLCFPAIQALAQELSAPVAELKRIVSEREDVAFPPDIYARLRLLEKNGDPELFTDLAYEIDLAQGAPDRRGTYLLELDSDAIAGGRARILQRYTVQHPITSGGGLLVASHFQHAVPFQDTDPGDPNYIAVSAEKPGVKFSSARKSRAGIHGGLEARAEFPFFEVIDGELMPGDRVTIDLGGNAGMDLPQTALSQYELPLYVQFDPSLPLIYVPGPTLEILPGTPAKLRLAASSLVRPGEQVKTQLRVEDRFGNLAAPGHLNLDVLVNGTFRGRLVARSNVESIEDMTFDTPGVYVLEVRSAGGGLRARSNPIIVREQEPFEILWAGFRYHSRLSDDLRTVDDIERNLAGKFDLVLRSEHGNYFDLQPAIEVDGVQFANVSGSVDTGGSIDRLSYRGDDVVVALAENPSDLRGIDRNLALAEIATPEGSHEWFIDEIASRGFRIGVIGSNHSHQFPSRKEELLTAIIRKPSESWFDALRSRRTFVTSSHRAVLLASANGVPQGSRLGLDAIRNVKAEVHSPVGIAAVELIKNGSVIRQFSQAGSDDYVLSLDLTSSSRPFSRTQSLPRNAREWIGYLLVRDSKINLRGANERFDVRVSPGGHRVDFLARTHGDTSSLLFELDSIDPDTIVEVNIAAGYEDAAWIPSDRLPSETPAMKFQIPLAEITNMNAVRQIEVNGYMDELVVRPVPRQAVTSLDVSFLDQSAPRIGDYYYFRVIHRDGSRTWSSPIYVGGTDEY